jgi:hypothetical protein
MKTPSIVLLNSIGFASAAQKVWYAANLLRVGTRSSAKVVLTPAVRAIPASGSNPAVPAVAEVASPAIVAFKGFERAIEIIESNINIKIVAYLPFESSPALIGASVAGIGGIKEITPPNIQPLSWLGLKASQTPETVTTEPLKLEQYFYKYALEVAALPNSLSMISNDVRDFGGQMLPCKKIEIELVRLPGFQVGLEDIQIGVIAVSGSENSDSAYLAYVDTLPTNAPEREFVAYVLALPTYHLKDGEFCAPGSAWFTENSLIALAGNGLVPSQSIFTSSGGSTFIYFTAEGQV